MACLSMKIRDFQEKEGPSMAASRPTGEARGGRIVVYATDEQRSQSGWIVVRSGCSFSWKSLRCARAALGLGLLTAALGLATPAQAQSGTPTARELDAARSLFQEAYRDEQEQRFAEALDKFQRVATVKESASVRYRIGSVLASLGRLREARDAFRALAASAASLPAKEKDIAASAAERAQALDRRIPRLLVRLQEDPPADARVMIDGVPVPVTTSPRPFEVDPGEHVVHASSPSSRTFETRIVVTETSESAITVLLAPSAPKDAPAPVLPPPPVRDADAPRRRDNALAFVALGVGGTFVVSGVALLVVREGTIRDLNRECAPVCPSSRRIDLEAKRDQAQLFGPIGVGVGALGLAAAAAGVYLLLRPSPRDRASPVPAARIVPNPVHGGARVDLHVMF